MNYEEFIASKNSVSAPEGIEDVPPLGDYLFDFQKDLVGFALRRARAAIFAAVGLGKTRMQGEFAAQASAHLESVGKRSDVMMLSPLGVAHQTVRELESLGIRAKYCKGPHEIEPGAFTLTNYDRLERFDTRRFGVVCLDESSILKHHTSKQRGLITASFADTEFRLALTATPAPNDVRELGTHSHFLGELTVEEMLAEYFIHDSGKTQKWRLKGHAKDSFWQWVASWGAMISRPSDLGYDNTGYDLPPLHVHDHIIGASIEQDRIVHAEASQLNLIPMPARSLKAQHKARKVSLEDRVKAAVEVVMSEPDEQWLVWCELNAESEALIAALAQAIPGAVEIQGKHSPERKEDAAIGFVNGSVRVLVSKSSIFGFGMNFQNCARACFVGVSHKFEEYHQALGRNLRFGQKRPVHAHLVYSELEGDIRANLQRKTDEFRTMQEVMRDTVAAYVKQNVRGFGRSPSPYNPQQDMILPRWIAA